MKFRLPPILVLPNRNTLGLAAVLGAMWYAGASQNNGAAYLLCFVVASVAIVSIPHAWNNLRQIELNAERIAPVYAGDEVRLRLLASSKSRSARNAVDVIFAGSAVPLRLPPLSHGELVRLDGAFPSRRRGAHELIPAVIQSTFPFGFFTARRRLEVRQSYVVYPAPIGDEPLPVRFDPTRETREGSRAEGDDYAGVRNWHVGESMRHIDWKAVSRGQPMMTKQWNSGAGHRLHLSWDALPELPQEARLSQLARWVIDAEQQGLDYGLEIPGTTLRADSGDAHFHRCLRALAVLPEVEDVREIAG